MNLRENNLKKVSLFSPQSIILISTNFPEFIRNPKGIDSLFSWILRTFNQQLSQAKWHFHHIRDEMGPYSIISIPTGPEIVKKLCVDLEFSEPITGLLNIDVFDRKLKRIKRKQLNLPERSCFLCDKPASVCLHDQSHNAVEITNRVNSLIDFAARSNVL